MSVSNKWSSKHAHIQFIGEKDRAQWWRARKGVQGNAEQGNGMIRFVYIFVKDLPFKRMKGSEQHTVGIYLTRAQSLWR